MVPQHLRRGPRQIQDAYVGHCRRDGLSRSLHAVLAVLHGAAAPKRPLQAAHLPRGRPLDHQAAKQPALVQNFSGLAGYLLEVGDSTVSGASAVAPMPAVTTSKSDSWAISERFRPKFLPD